MRSRPPTTSNRSGRSSLAWCRRSWSPPRSWARTKTGACASAPPSISTSTSAIAPAPLLSLAASLVTTTHSGCCVAWSSATGWRRREFPWWRRRLWHRVAGEQQERRDALRPVLVGIVGYELDVVLALVIHATQSAASQSRPGGQTGTNPKSVFLSRATADRP